MGYQEQLHWIQLKIYNYIKIIYLKKTYNILYINNDLEEVIIEETEDTTTETASETEPATETATETEPATESTNDGRWFAESDEDKLVFLRRDRDEKLLEGLDKYILQDFPITEEKRENGSYMKQALEFNSYTVFN